LATIAGKLRFKDDRETLILNDAAPHRGARKSQINPRHPPQADRTHLNARRISMQHEAKKLQPAQAEVRRTAHDQDLIEVPRRARLDREAEKHAIHPPRTKLEED
jgi:hypothetical protein